MTRPDPRRWTAAATATLGLSLISPAVAAWLSLAAQASTAELNLSITGDDHAASISADGKQLTFSAKGPLGSAFSFQHRMTVSNTGDTAGTGTLSLGTAGPSTALAQAIHGRVVQVTPTVKTLIDANVHGGGTTPLNLPAHSAKTFVVSFSLNCAPLGAQVCADVSGQSVTAVLQLAQTAVPVVIEPSPAERTPQPGHVATPPPNQTSPAPSPASSTPAPLQPVLSLGLPSLFTGGKGTIFGQNCPPGSAVTFTADGQRVGATTATSDGTFSGAIQLPDISVGSHPVGVTCGGQKAQQSVNLSLSTSSAIAPSVGAAAGVVLLFFLLLGTLLYARMNEVGKNNST